VVDVVDVVVVDVVLVVVLVVDVGVVVVVDVVVVVVVVDVVVVVVVVVVDVGVVIIMFVLFCSFLASAYARQHVLSQFSSQEIERAVTGRVSGVKISWRAWLGLLSLSSVWLL